MLLELEKYGILRKYFIKKQLKYLSESKKDGFDSINNEVIDFDETWKIFNKTHSYKSADALIFKDIDKLLFIEFKWIENSTDVSNFIKNLCLKSKVRDSFEILRSILREKRFLYKDKINLFDNSKKQFIFSNTNLTPELEFLLLLEIPWLEDLENNLEVFWIDTKEIESYL